MFKKPFKTKSNCQLKTSEKKKLLLRIKNLLPQLDEDNELFNIKEPMNTIKVTTYLGVHVNIYVHSSTPVFFELHDVIYPTIFTLWKFPHLVYTFATHDAVLGKLYNGADLMLPGVLYSSGFSWDINMLIKGRPAAVCTDKNLASVAVGQSMISGEDIARGLNVGRGLKILHTLGDQIEKLLDEVPILPIIPHSIKQSPRDLGSGDNSLTCEQHKTVYKEIISEEKICCDVDNLALHSFSQNDEVMNQPSTAHGDTVEHESDLPCGEVSQNENCESINVATNMDELAVYCLLKSLHSKNLELPILTNLFYSKFMLNCVPEGLELNIKKTKHKKLSNMLKDMMDQGVLVMEDNKGVSSIINVNQAHPIFKDIRFKYEAFEGMKTNSVTPEEGSSSLEKLEEIKENLLVNKLVAPLLKNTSFQKGDVISITQMREIIVAYIKETGLTPPTSKTVVLDPILSDVINTRQTVLPWSDLINKIIDKMPTCYTITTSRGRVTSGKGKLPQIDISTATRSGNKSVTMVNNLEKYGVNINEFARHCQHALAASTTTHPTPSGVQFQVQGSQKAFICALLVDRYNIPQRVIPGFVDKSKGKKNRK